MVVSPCAWVELSEPSCVAVRLSKVAVASAPICVELRPAKTSGLIAVSSVVVTAAQQREGWDVLPCYVRGTARSASGLWRWEIRAGGTATLETPAGDSELRACTGCEIVMGRPSGKQR